MRRALLATLVLASTTAACQTAAPRVDLPDARNARSERPRAEATRTPARPGEAPAAPVVTSAPAARVSQAPVATGQLLRPAGDSTVLAGSVAVDASYLVAKGGGNILSHNGALIIAAGGASLVGADAASLIAAGAGNLIATGAGNLIAAGAGNLIAAGAGNLVAAGAGNVVAPNGARYRLAAAAATDVALGAVLPAAGMQLAVRDLRNGAPVALGADAAGQPVFAVYSNADGAFELYVPKALASNLRVEARVPGAQDPRLAYEVLALPGGAPAAIDEDSALVYHYLAESWRGRMRSLMTELAVEPPRSDEAVIRKLYGRGGTAAFQAMLGLLKPLITELRAGMKAADVASPAAIAAASARAADTVLARIDLSGLVAKQAPEYAPFLTGEEKAFTVFIDAVKQVRAAAAAQMRAAGPAGRAAFLTAAPYAASDARIAKPSDVPAYIVAEAYTDEQDIQAGAAVAYFRPLGFDGAAALRLQGRLWAANAAAGEHLAVLLATDPSVKADLIAALRTP